MVEYPFNQCFYQESNTLRQAQIVNNFPTFPQYFNGYSQFHEVKQEKEKYYFLLVSEAKFISNPNQKRDMMTYYIR